MIMLIHAGSIGKWIPVIVEIKLITRNTPAIIVIGIPDKKLISFFIVIRPFCYLDYHVKIKYNIFVIEHFVWFYYRRGIGQIQESKYLNCKLWNILVNLYGKVIMDRRQQKTRDAIFKAFSKLLETKQFNNITVQEIIDKANIGRSTFYAHFETKDELLRAMCTDIFSHVFSEDLISEKTHDFSEGDNGLQTKLTHILYHLKDNKRDIVGILSCESSELFMRYFKEYLSDLFSKYLNEIKVDAPIEFVLNYLVGSFAQAVTWWIQGKMQHTPEEIASYYMAVIQI